MEDFEDLEDSPRWKGFDTSVPMVFLVANKMNTAFIKMHQPTRVSGDSAEWQRCSLDYGIAGKDF